MDSSSAEKAWEEYVDANAEHLSGWEREDFMAGRASRDAEVAEAEHDRDVARHMWGEVIKDAAVLREQLAAARDDALKDAEAAVARTRAANLTSYYGIQDWIAGRTAAQRAIAALRSGTEGKDGE